MFLIERAHRTNRCVSVLVYEKLSLSLSLTDYFAFVFLPPFYTNANVFLFNCIVLPSFHLHAIQWQNLIQTIIIDPSIIVSFLLFGLLNVHPVLILKIAAVFAVSYFRLIRVDDKL